MQRALTTLHRIGAALAIVGVAVNGALADGRRRLRRRRPTGACRRRRSCAMLREHDGKHEIIVKGHS